METLVATKDGRVLYTENCYRESAVGSLLVTVASTVKPNVTLIARQIVVYKTIADVEGKATGYGEIVFRGTMKELIGRLENENTTQAGQGTEPNQTAKEATE